MSQVKTLDSELKRELAKDAGLVTEAVSRKDPHEGAKLIEQTLKARGNQVVAKVEGEDIVVKKVLRD